MQSRRPECGQHLAMSFEPPRGVRPPGAASRGAVPSTPPDATPRATMAPIAAPCPIITIPDVPRTVLDKLDPDAIFEPVPVSYGQGDLLAAEVSDGVVAVAPPWAGLAGDEEADELSHWRAGWWPLSTYEGDDGADLTTPASERERVSLRDIAGLAQLAPHFDRVRNAVAARARSLARRAASAGEDDARARVIGELAAIRAEWIDALPDEPWPLDRDGRTSHAPAGGRPAAARRGELWVTDRAFSDLGVTYRELEPMLVLVLGDGRVEGGLTWYDVVPADTRADAATWADAVLTVGESTYDTPLRLRLDRQLRVARGQLQRRLGSLTATGIETLQRVESGATGDEGFGALADADEQPEEETSDSTPALLGLPYTALVERMEQLTAYDARVGPAEAMAPVALLICDGVVAVIDLFGGERVPTVTWDADVPLATQTAGRLLGAIYGLDPETDWRAVAGPMLHRSAPERSPCAKALRLLAIGETRATASAAPLGALDSAVASIDVMEEIGLDGDHRDALGLAALAERRLTQTATALDLLVKSELDVSPRLRADITARLESLLRRAGEPVRHTYGSRVSRQDDWDDLFRFTHGEMATMGDAPDTVHVAPDVALTGLVAPDAELELSTHPGGLVLAARQAGPERGRIGGISHGGRRVARHGRYTRYACRGT